MALRINVQIPDELVVDDKSLGFVFARPLRFVYTSMWSISSFNICPTATMYTN